MPAETVIPKRRPVSRTSVSSSAAALEPLITKLYDGTAELRISIPQRQANRMQAPVGEKEIVYLNLPSGGKHADEHARIVSLISSLTLVLLNDSDSAKQNARKAAQAKGISKAKAEGKQFGKRRLDFDADLFAEICRAYANKEISVDTAGERLGCSGRTFRRRYATEYLGQIDTAEKTLEQGA